MVKPLMLLPPLVFAALAAVFYLGMREGEQPLPSTMEGRMAPQVQVQVFGDTAPPTDADLTAPGVKLVNFWASWCQPCRAEHPMLSKLQAEGVAIYGINYKDQLADAQGFLGEMGNPYARIGADSGKMALNWGVYGVPETYVIDGTGKVILRFAGPITEATLNSTIRPALAAAAGQ